MTNTLNRPLGILLLTDKLGITPAYKRHWDEMVQNAGLGGARIIEGRLTTIDGKTPMLVKYGNRKSPGFNPALTQQIKTWVEAQVRTHNISLILCQDPAILGLVEPNQALGTINTLRGGLYQLELGETNKRVVSFLVLTPVSAINTKIQAKDVRILNRGYESREAWDEDTHAQEEMFIEPYYIPQGRWILEADLAKAARVWHKIQIGEQT